MIISPQKVEYIDHMGSDLSVVNAARVSFDKVSGWDMGGVSSLAIQIEGAKSFQKLKTEDRKLIKYLAKHNHWTPFGHATVSLRLHCPIFVARQLVKHQVGLVWNEVSRRYVNSHPEFYMPEYLRPTAESVKQGSQDVPHPLNTVLMAKIRNHTEEGFLLYCELVDLGVCPEQARIVLGLNTHTDWVWTGSLAAWARVANLRLDPHTQKETREIARPLSDTIRPLFPVSWEVLVDSKVNL